MCGLWLIKRRMTKKGLACEQCLIILKRGEIDLNDIRESSQYSVRWDAKPNPLQYIIIEPWRFFDGVGINAVSIPTL